MWYFFPSLNIFAILRDVISPNGFQFHTSFKCVWFKLILLDCNSSVILLVSHLIILQNDGNKVNLITTLKFFAYHWAIFSVISNTKSFIWSFSFSRTWHHILTFDKFKSYFKIYVENWILAHEMSSMLRLELFFIFSYLWAFFRIWKV
jgi:hypothetical protein